jgi:multisubunit Na+/H+ antiporter MnhF subunit
MNEIQDITDKLNSSKPSNDSSIRANLRTFTEDKKQVKVFLSALYAVLNTLPTEQLGKIAHIIDDAKLKGGRRKAKKTKKRRQSKTMKTKKTKRRKSNTKTNTKRRIGGTNYYNDSSSEDDTASNNSQDDMECSICLDTFEIILPNEDMMKISHGQGENPHYFHKYCLKRYFEVSRNTTCPTCKTPFPRNQVVDLGFIPQALQEQEPRTGYILQIMTFVAVSITVLASISRGEMMETGVVLAGTLYQVFKALLEILSIYLRENTVINPTQLLAIIAFVTIVFLRRSQR